MIRIKVKNQEIELTAQPAVDGSPRQGLFNPTSYSVAKETTWEEKGIPGHNLAGMQFKWGANKRIAMSLLFDTFEAGVDVRSGPGGTDQLAKMTEVSETDQNNTPRPPLLQLYWGDKPIGSAGLSDWVLLSYTIRYTLFAQVGGGVVPVRALVDLSFKEYIDPKDDAKSSPTAKANKAKVHTVVQGETLSGIAAKEYGDPGEWRRIAAANQISDPRRLQTGRQIVIPPKE